MKILIDECLPERLKKSLEEFDAYTVSELEWKGLANGELLSQAIINGFEIFLTVDKQLPHQQNLKSFDIAVIVFEVPRNKLELISPLIQKLKRNSSFYREKNNNYYPIILLFALFNSSF